MYKAYVVNKTVSSSICFRFIAVTQPIKYAKHKNSKRVHVMLALTWVISVAIAAPIALGVNYSDARVPGSCGFFNSDFLIYSSMGSFYIPSLLMIFLYWRIYRVLRQRAKRLRANKKARHVDTQTLTNVIENQALNEPTVKTGLASMDNGKVYNTNNCNNKNNHEQATETNLDEASTSNPPTDSNEKDDDDDEDSDTKSPLHIPVGGELIINPVAEDLDRREQLLSKKNDIGIPVASLTSEAETNFMVKDAKTLNQETEDSSSGKTSNDGKGRRKKEKKNATKFNFHMRTSRKRKEKSSSRRERKATKTLAIVLGKSRLSSLNSF